MTVTEAREIMRDQNYYRNGNIKYINTYKIVEKVGDFDLVLYSEKTGKRVVVQDHEDLGGFTGAELR